MNLEFYSSRAIKFQSFFIYLIPICIVTGPFLPDAIISISSLIFLVISIKKKFYKYYDNTFFKFFILFWIYICFSSLWAINVFVSLKSSFFFIRFGIFSILLLYIIDNNRNFIKFFSIILFITFFIVLVDSYIQYFFGSNIFGMQSPQHDRLSSFFGDELIVGSFLSRLFPLLLAFGILMSKKGINYYSALSIMFLILTDIIIFLTGERTSFGLLIVTNLIYIFFITKFKFFRVLAFLISITVIFFIINYDDNAKNRMITQTLKEFQINENNFIPGEFESSKKDNTIQLFSAVHQSHYMTAINMFQKNFLLGVGPNMFRYECSNKDYAAGKYNCTTHPHHLHLQILAETGLIGYLFILIIILSLIKFFLQKLILIFKRKDLVDDYQTCLMICFLLTLFPFAPSGNFFNNWISIIYFLPVGFYLHLIQNKNEY